MEDFLTDYIILSIAAKIPCNRKMRLIMEFFSGTKVCLYLQVFATSTLFQWGVEGGQIQRRNEASGLLDQTAEHAQWL